MSDPAATSPSETPWAPSPGQTWADARSWLPPQPPPGTPVPSEVSGTKIAAGITGILLGSLGVHKFILGYTSAGVIMLLVTILGGLLTCGTASGVIWLIGLIEGIVYLTRSDDAFWRTYVLARRPWF